MNKKGIIVTITAGLFLAGAIAVGASNIDTKENINIHTAQNTTNTEILSVAEVKEIALEKFDGKIEEVELDDFRYEVEIETTNEDIELKIDAFTGEILKVERDDRDGWKSNAHTTTTENQTNSTILTVDEATKIAEEKTGATVYEIELDEDDGRILYEVELYSSHTEIEMEIDAKTGEILEIEYDD